MKLRLITVAVATICATPAMFAQATTFFDLDGALTGWTTGGNVTSQNSTYSLPTLGSGYEISPAAGKYMAVIQPSGSATGAAGIAAATGLTGGLINSVLTGDAGGGSDTFLQPTNFGFISNTYAFDAGTTYSFAWAYASQDYVPYADGVFFAMSGGGEDEFKLLARTTREESPQSVAGVTTGFPAGTVVLESFGSTNWYAHTFNVDSSGDYQISFGSFNAGDSIVHPILFISDIVGSVIGEIVGGGGISVYGAADAVGNKVALSAAKVIDESPALLAFFSAAGFADDKAISEAATSTLPLLTGHAQLAAASSLVGVDRIVRARMDWNKGLSSGEGFIGDRHFWVKPFGSWSNQGSKRSVPGFKSDTGGLAIGVDGMTENGLRLGAALAYAKADVDGKAAVSGHGAKIDLYQLMGYGGYSLDERTELEFKVGIGSNRTKGRREIAFVDRVAKSSYDSLVAHVGAGVSRQYDLNERTTVSPSIRLDYTRIEDESYREKGAQEFDLSVRRRTSEAFVLGLDGRVDHETTAGVQLTANLGLGYDFAASRSRITATYAASPGSSFTVRGVRPGPLSVRGGVGVSNTSAQGVDFSARYDVEAGDRFTNQTVSVNVRWAF